MAVTIRHAVAADLPRITEIYDTYIVDSHISFDEEPWTEERRDEWWNRYQGRVLVADDDGDVIGTAFAGPWRHKHAYSRSAETTIVMAPHAVGAGVGTQLLGALIDLLDTQDIHRAYAVIALPNDASIALHEKLGYRHVGVLGDVGFKLGRYWSTLLMERAFD